MRLAPAPQIKVATAKAEPKVEVHLEAKSKPVERPKPEPVQVTTTVVETPRVAPTQPQDANFYKMYIYQHESGNCPFKWQGDIGACPSSYVAKYDPNAQIGYGLCQSTPAAKMQSAGADWATSYATQDAWCTNYAMQRYGGWQQAYNHWLINHNW